METLLPMSHERIESLSSLPTPRSSDSRALSQATYPALTASPNCDSERVATPPRHAGAALISVTTLSANLNESAFNSQETHVSSSSKASGIPQLESDSSNVSNGSFDTNSTSPVSANGPLGQKKKALLLQAAQPQRLITPEVRKGVQDTLSEGGSSNNSTSPMSLDTLYLKQGSKRTASGAVKPLAVGDVPAYSIQSTVWRSPVRVRNSSKAAEISAQLKMKLSYAMVKVQHGWENQTLEQLERLPSQPVTPIPSQSASRRRVSGASDRYFPSPGSEASPPQPSRMFPPRAPSSQVLTGYQATTGRYSPPAVNSPANGLSLAPAAPISPRRPGRRSMSSHAPPSLITARLPLNVSGQQPTTPTSNPGRQGILRMPSQQAEKDALETLMFMSSPNNSSNLKHTASAASSPLRSEFPPIAKRVVFEHDS